MTEYKSYEIDIDPDTDRLVGSKLIDGVKERVFGNTIAEIKEKIDKEVKVKFERVTVYKASTSYNNYDAVEVTLTSYSPNDNSCRYKKNGRNYKHSSYDSGVLVPITKDTTAQIEAIKKLYREQEILSDNIRDAKLALPIFDVMKHAKM